MQCSCGWVLAGSSVCQGRVCVFPQQCAGGTTCCNPGQQACSGTCCNYACVQGRCLPFGSTVCGSNVCSSDRVCFNNQVRRTDAPGKAQPQCCMVLATKAPKCLHATAMACMCSTRIGELFKIVVFVMLRAPYALLHITTACLLLA
jgi:hypothetical protein